MIKFNCLNIESEKYIYDNIRDFSIETCNNVIPSVVDGLKVVQRIGIFVRENSLNWIKTISASGEMISSNLYVHGDAPASLALSAMASKYSNNYCYLDGKGTFGTKINPNAYASPRYTYIKLSTFSKNILLIDREIIPMKDNYDGSVQQPIYYLPLVPTVLLNGIKGVGYGWSTNILPHKIEDVISMCIDVLKNKNIENKYIMPYYKNNVVDCKKDNTEDINKYIFKSKVEKLSDISFRITELAPNIELTKVINNINELEDKNIVSSYENNTKDTVDIKITFKRGTRYNEEDILNLCKLYSVETERLVVIDFDNNSIKSFDSHFDLVKEFIEFRKKFFYKRYEYLIEKNNKELNYLYFVSYCFDKKIFENVGKLDKSSFKNYLSSLYDMSSIKWSDIEKQENVEKISNLPLFKWTVDEKQKIDNKIKNIQNENDVYKDIISSDDKITQQYINELKNLLRVLKNIKE